MSRHRGLIWTMSGSQAVMVSDLNPEELENTLSFLRGLEVPPKDARLCTVEICEVDEDRPTDPGTPADVEGSPV